jgi:molybdenum cofactor cytidylyltransferase
MPGIPARVIQQVAAGLARGADIVAPVCRGQRGHPVGFAARHAAALLALNADSGARDIIAAHRDTLELIETPHSGVIVDINTPAALPAG